MNILTFRIREFNYIFGERGDYFILQTPAGRRLLICNRCPHRGGPLHLGEFDSSRKKLVCPWHGTEISENVLKRNSLPLISRSDRVTVILDESPTGLMLANRLVLANESRQQQRQVNSPAI